MRIRCCVGIVALVAACGPLNKYERQGDKLLAQGDKQGAAKEYEWALKDLPMMDFDYERISEKRQRIVGEEWKPKVAQSLAASAGGSPIDRLEAILVTRHGARAAAAGKDIVQPLEKEVRVLSSPDNLAAANSADAETRIPRLLALFDVAMAQSAPQATIDAIVEALTRSFAHGLPTPTDGVSRVEMLFATRKKIREYRMPTALDRTVSSELAKLGSAPIATVTAATALAEFSRASELRAIAVAYGEIGPALSLISRAQDAALVHLVPPADQMIAAHHYIAAADYLEPFVKNVALDHSLRAKYAQLGKDAIAWHVQTGNALPAGYRKLLELAQGNAFGDTPGYRETREALAADFTTSLALVPTYAAGSECAQVTQRITSALPSGALSARVRVDLRCALRIADSTESRTQTYVTEEEYIEKVPYEVQDRVWEQIGSHDEQCSKDSSLDGHVWTGVCKVPDYGWKTYTRTEYRDEVRVRDLNGSAPYTVSVKTATADLSGSVSYTWEDGTVLTVPVEANAKDVTQAWNYSYPGRRLNEAPRTETKNFDTGFSLSATTGTATSSFAGSASTKLHASVRAHRAKLARALGAAALGRNELDAAGDAFVRSVLLDGKAEAEAATWLTSAHALTSAQAESVLAAQKRRGPPELVAKTLEVAYEGGTPSARGDGYEGKLDDVAMDVSSVTQKTYHKGIRPPNEFFSGHFGLMPVSLSTTGGTKTSVTMGMGLNYSLLGMAAPRYWLTWHDEGGARLIFGMRYAGREYTNDEDESTVAWGFQPYYKAFLGFRHHYFAVFGGGGIGWTRMRAGDTLAKGRNLEPAARLLLRMRGLNNVVVEASGFRKLADGWATKDRVAVGIPLHNAHQLELLVSWERTSLNTTDVNMDQREMFLGKRDVTMYGIQIGGRL